MLRRPSPRCAGSYLRRSNERLDTGSSALTHALVDANIDRHKNVTRYHSAHLWLQFLIRVGGRVTHDMSECKAGPDQPPCFSWRNSCIAGARSTPKPQRQHGTIGRRPMHGRPVAPARCSGAESTETMRSSAAM